MSALFFTAVVVIVVAAAVFVVIVVAAAVFVVIVVVVVLLLLLLSMLTLNKETKLDRLKIILKALNCFKHTGCGGGLTVGILYKYFYGDKLESQ